MQYVAICDAWKEQEDQERMVKAKERRDARYKAYVFCSSSIRCAGQLTLF